jgi:murein DD-endopeptidase MepM/ murein hydrolase activator NlpD
MADFDLQSITDILKDIKEIFQSGKSSMRSSPVRQAPLTPDKESIPVGEGRFQSPIRGSWKNSGAFSPSQATDPRHPQGHAGIDLRAPGGTAIYPLAPGVVTNIGIDPKGGNVINIQHADGIRTYYAHLGTVRVHKGDKVSMDDAIATVGDSGNARGTVPHLHFQVWQNGQLRNPGDYFTVPKYSNMTSDEQRWLPGQEEVARGWKMQDHLRQSRVAFTDGAKALETMSAVYCRLIGKL